MTMKQSFRFYKNVRLIFSMGLALLLLLTVLSLTACQKNLGRSSNSKDFVSGLYQQIIKGSLTYDAIYEKYFSSLSQSAFSKEQYLDAIAADPIRSGAKLLSISGETTSESVKLSEEHALYNVSKVKLNVEYEKDGETATGPLEEYVIWESGEPRLLYRNVFRAFYKEMSMIQDSNPIHCTEMWVYALSQGIMLDIMMENPTTATYAIGKESGASVTCGATYTDTETGHSAKLSWTMPAESALRISPGETGMVTAIFPEGYGRLTNVKMLNIYELDSSGTPIQSGDGMVYNMSLLNSDNIGDNGAS